MRAGLSTIQQTLTPEAVGVLNLSIADAARRNHGQTTPLHVAATLLAAPSGFLRQACIKSHPNSSHPLQCRALELCFSVALERLPTAQGSALEPPISNALMAALKRAQAHQRRGCPEQQQQPLLAVKVELEQLIISILDDPSVSRVMREASFSSPAVKATIEQSLNSAAQPSPGTSSSPVGLGFRPSIPPTRNLYLNPRLQQQPGGATSGGAAATGPRTVHQRSEDVKKVVEILLGSRRRNPVVVGESEPEAVVRDLVKKIEAKELNDGALKNVHVISLKEFGSDKSETVTRLKELRDLVDVQMRSRGIILNFGDLKWLVEQPAAAPGSAGPILCQAPPKQHVVSEVTRVAVAEVAKLLSQFGEAGNGSGGRVWLIGTATWETYLRCQVYHPSMENDWDLQAVPIAAQSPLPGLFSRLGTTGVLGNSVESVSPHKKFPTTVSNSSSRLLSDNLNPAQKTNCCPLCTQGYEQELGKIKATDLDKSSPEVRSALPQWLQNAKVHPAQEGEDLGLKQRIQELQKKWNETCLRSHPQFHQQLIGPERINPTPFCMTGLYKPNLLLKQNPEPKFLYLDKNLNVEAQTQTPLLKPNPTMQSRPNLRIPSPPRSPVQTDLVLGQTRATTEPTLEKPAQKEDLRDFLGCITQELPMKVYEFQCEKLMSISDTDSFKKLLKRLKESVWWQQDAASALATIMNQSKLGNAIRSADSRGDLWILFGGPDRVGKKKMGFALSELLCGAAPVTISFGSRRDTDLSFRGKTALDRIAEGVRRNPFSVVILEDVDEADMLVRVGIKRAMERGRIADSHGREISLGNVTFVLTTNWVPDNVKFSSKSGSSFAEEKLAGLAQEGWQLKLSVTERTSKRRASWLHGINMAVKLRKEMDNSNALGFDLNEAADYLDNRTDGSHNSSDLTVEHECDHNRLDNRLSSTSVVYRELLCHVHDLIIFKPVDIESLQETITSSISSKFSSIFGDQIAIDIQEEALDRILGGLWLGRTGLEEWTHCVLIPSFDQLKERLLTKQDESMVVRLECGRSSDPWGHGEWLPQQVELAVDGL